MAAADVVRRALDSLGKGFDLSSDFRLKYCKGDSRLVLLNDSDNHDLSVPGFGSFSNVSVDIKCDKGDRTRYQSDILGFNQMSEFFNRKSSVGGKIPSGLFNSMFGFESGSWARDAANTKFLGLDGYFITLFDVHIDRYPLLLDDRLVNDVPTTWDPSALARFIEKYGTHIIVGLSLGGKDVVLVKQDTSSDVDASQLKKHLDNLGNQLFTGACPFSPNQPKTDKPPQAFNVFDPQSTNLFSSYAKDGISVMCSKRGGDITVNSHCEWLLTVPNMPDAIRFNFIPITSLLGGISGKGFLSHAINLYLRYKPPITDLRYFLDFQAHKVWAPIHNDLPLGPIINKPKRTPALRFDIMGPKLYVNTTQVSSENTPVTGIRLYLEGPKGNRLGIHLQHLTNPPVLLRHSASISWRGSEQIPGNHLYFDPVRRKKFSHICTAPVKYDPTWLSSSTPTAFIVTGAQLHIKNHNSMSMSVIHLRLCFSRIPGWFVAQSGWMEHASEHQTMSRSGFFSAISTSNQVDKERNNNNPVIVDSAVYPVGPPPGGQKRKMLKFVDTSEMCRGAADNPGHWLVTGAKLDLEKGKICVRVKFSLLNLAS